ncbi:SRPBCC domain-containing protein [Seohaeicola saemankumensis]|nr:SRPBCC domain-containing protein [Seohaeicola saemankumensis]MCA0870605.1 SRPBCC domain-containing protein [Seohaeicola saemankumensis]
MTDLHMTRDFPIPPERLFAWVSRPENLLKWWGPEGMHVPEGDLDFTRTGPWYSVMVNGDGQRFKVSGHVTHVTPPTSLGFTWGWHDDNDRRGPESHVTFTISEAPNGSRLILDHRDLHDSDQSQRHEQGWASTLRKLAALLD